MKSRIKLPSKLSLEDLRPTAEARAAEMKVPFPPKKPEIGEFGLSDKDTHELFELNRKARQQASYILWGVFVLSAGGLAFSFSVRWLPLHVLLGWAATQLAKRIWLVASSMTVDEWLLERVQSKLQKEKRVRYEAFSKARSNWSIMNQEFEKALSRGLHLNWLSKTGSELEYAVAGLFEDLDYQVEINGGPGDRGVDLFLRKDGQLTVVQCKAFGKPCGPAPVREVFGAMHAFHADSAMVVCPRGFTGAAEEFAKGKPIQLLSVDDLAQAYYRFDNYLPHWLSNPLDTKELIRNINKQRFS